MSARASRPMSNADGLSVNVLKAIRDTNTNPSAASSSMKSTTMATTPKTTEEDERESPNTDLRHLNNTQHSRGVGGSSLDITSLSTFSKRSLHSSRLTLSDSKEFYKTTGCDWIRAVRRGDATSVKKMLEDNPELVSYVPTYGPLALHVAAARSDRSIIALLVAKGVDMDTRDAAGYTSLHLAIQRGNQSLAHFLISQGANIELTDPDGLRITDYDGWTQHDQIAARIAYNGSFLRPTSHSRVCSPSLTSVKSLGSLRPARPSSTPDSSFLSENGNRELKREGKQRSSWKSVFENTTLGKKLKSGPHLKS